MITYCSNSETEEELRRNTQAIRAHQREGPPESKIGSRGVAEGVPNTQHRQERVSIEKCFLELVRC